MGRRAFKWLNINMWCFLWGWVWDGRSLDSWKCWIWRVWPSLIYFLESGRGEKKEAWKLVTYVFLGLGSTTALGWGLRGGELLIGMILVPGWDRKSEPASAFWLVDEKVRWSYLLPWVIDWGTHHGIKRWSGSKSCFSELSFASFINVRSQSWENVQRPTVQLWAVETNWASEQT